MAHCVGGQPGEVEARCPPFRQIKAKLGFDRNHVSLFSLEKLRLSLHFFKFFGKWNDQGLVLLIIIKEASSKTVRIFGARRINAGNECLLKLLLIWLWLECSAWISKRSWLLWLLVE